MSEEHEHDLVVSRRYRIDKTLGQGGMGVVYEAFDLSLDRKVALKMIHPHLTVNQSFVHRFEIEAKAVAQLDHPNLLRLYDFNNDGDQLYMVLQYLEGETLQARLTGQGDATRALPLDEAIQITLDVCAGLTHAHARKLVHRDIKPANLMLLPEGSTVLMDFGIAKLLDETSITAHGTVMGTALYMSPEQVRGEPADGRADIYSLGVILYEMLAGRRPFHADSHSAMLLMHLNAPVPDVRSFTQYLSPALTALLEKALAKERADRFQTAAEFATALREISLQDDETEIVTRPAASKEAASADIEVAANIEAVVEPESNARLIRYDPATQEHKLRLLLDDFAEAVRRDNFAEVIGRDFVKRVNAAVAEIDHRLAADFNVVVMGDFKRGKSTFINALLGSAIVTTDVLPETVTINRICYGPALKVEACFADGGQMTLRHDELKSDRLNKIIAGLAQRPSHLHIEAPLDWLRGVQLVDTPGLNDFLSGYDHFVHESLHEADAVLFMISALSPLSESERTFLQHTLRPYEFSKVCFLVNRLDALDTESDALRIVEATRNRLLNIFPNAKLFGVSALREFQRTRGKAQPDAGAADYMDANFAALRQYLKDSLIFNRDLIQVERGITLVDKLLRDCEMDVRRLRTSVEASQSQVDELIVQCENKNSDLYRRIDAHKQRLRADISDLGEQAAEWMSAFTKRFQREVIAKLETFKHEDVQKHLPFFLADSFHAALTQCSDAHLAKIAEALHTDNTLLSDLRHSGELAAAPLFLKNLTAHASFDSGQWTYVDSVQFALWYAGFDSTLGRLLTGLVGGKLTAGENLSRYRAQLNQSLPELQQSVTTLINQKYEAVAARVEEMIDAAYQQQIASVLSALRQARDLRSAGAQQADEVNKTLALLLDTIEQSRAAVQAFHDQLQVYGQDRIVELLDS